MKSVWIQSQVMAAGVLCAACAMAQSTPLSRADVTQELSRARAAGELDHGSTEAMLPASMAPTSMYAAQQRSEVVAELVRARSAGELDFAQWEVQLPLPAGRVTSRPLMAEATPR